MPLSRLLLQERDSRTTVAWRRAPDRMGSAPVKWAEFRQQVAGLSARVAQGPPGAWLLATEDAYAFAVGLFALWHSGRSAISPPNHQAGSLSQLQTVAAGVLSDRGDWFPGGEAIDPLQAIDPSPAASIDSLQPLSADALAIEIFTSGTTGAGKSVAKQLSHLQEEVERLEKLWGDRIGTAVVFGTASHQHLYGMLFRVLWPLAAGRAFQSDLVLHASELIPRMRARGDCVLASVPTHLKRMVKQRGVEELRQLCRATFSSGGLLQTETALLWRDAVGEAPFEIFGSTETGGVAWRAQNELPRDSGWTPLPNVEVSRSEEDGRLEVRSPFVSVGAGNESIVIGDRIRWLDDGRFELGGRADRVVKVGEKRLDLEQMESALRSHGFVDEIALVLVEQEGESRVAAVVVASEDGRRMLASESRSAFGRELSKSLAADWDRVLLPRLWRNVDALPENAQGKITADALRALFTEPGDDSSAAEGDAPQILEQRIDENSALQVCRVPDDLACFPDHFPNFPVVPGVLQLNWALDLAERMLGHELDLRELEALKFGSTLGPGERFELRVERSDAHSISFRICSGDREFASGRARIAGDPSS